jgi:hypothetical protein
MGYGWGMVGVWLGYWGKPKYTIFTYGRPPGPMEAVVASLRITCKMAYPNTPTVPHPKTQVKLIRVNNIKLFYIVIIKE